MTRIFKDLASSLIDEGWQGAKQEIPETVYHYTNAAGLIGILSTKSFWATEYRFMNDRSEVHLGIRRAQKTVEDMILREKDEYRLRYLKNIIELIKRPFNESNYIASFTDRKDDLSQWRGYANEGKGFTIGFDARKISELSKRTNAFSFGKVNYNLRRYLDTIKHVVEKFYHALVENDEKDILKCCSECDAVISSISASYKHSSFQSESEWRIHLYPDPMSIKVRASGSGLRPYAVLDPAEAFDENFPIKEIGIGPAYKSQEYEYAIRRLLSQYEISADVYTANNPYRIAD